MKTIDKAICYMEMSTAKISEINDALKKTTYKPALKVFDEQLSTLLWVNELVMRAVDEEAENDEERETVREDH